MDQAQATAEINALTDQIAKIKTEVEALIEAVNNNGSVSAELETAITNAKNALQIVDDLNVDQP